MLEARAERPETPQCLSLNVSLSPWFWVRAAQVHARAELVVDVAAVGQLLRAKLPGVLAGRRVSELEEPWPEPS